MAKAKKKTSQDLAEAEAVKTPSQDSTGVEAKKKTSQDLAMDFVNSLVGLKYVFCSGDGWYHYSEKTGWKQVPDWEVKSEANKFCWQSVPETVDLSRQRLNDVFELVKTSLTVCQSDNDSLDPTLWIRFENGGIRTESASGWIACNNNLIDVEAVACALYNKKPVPEEAIKPLSSELFTLGRVPCDFEPGTECPRWLQFVSEVCSKDIDRLNLQRLFGLSLTYNRNFNVFFVVYGGAGTGKSTGLSVLEKMNSGLVCAVSLSRFGEPFDTFPLTENRLNLVSDLPSVLEKASKVEEREAVLKNVTGGDFWTVQKKHENGIRQRLRALCVFGSNQIPRFMEQTRAIQDRLRLIPFLKQFRYKAGQDMGLNKKLLKELPGIFIWSLEGYGELIVKEYKTIPESEETKGMKHEAELQANPLLEFCEECLEACPGSPLSTNTVYLMYQVYCKRGGLEPMAMNLAIPQIKEQMKVEKKRKSKGWFFIGIRPTFQGEELAGIPHNK